ncbi:MAG: hypothetical protein ABFC24_01895 [Methanoregulaceae archaeon]
MELRPLKQWVSRVLLVVTILLLLTGFGITYSRIITPLTLGFLGKATSYQIHLILWGPFTVLLLFHLYLNIIPRNFQ